MMSKKSLIYLITGVVVIVFLVTFSAKWLSQKNTTEKTSNVPTGFKEVEKEATPDKSLVAGKIVSLRGNSLTLLKISPNLSQNEESSINLKIPQIGAQFFSQNGTEKKEIQFSGVKLGSFVNVEYRESAGEVMNITVIETDKTEEKNIESKE